MSRNDRGRAGQWWVYVLVFCALAAAPARAFDPFGWFTERPPQPAPGAIPYELTVVGLDADAAAKSAVNDVSILYRLRREPPQSGDELVRRAESDLPRIIDALWGAGYYDASVAVRIAGHPLTIQSPSSQAARSAADRLKGRATAPVEIVVEPGPLYRFNQISITQAGERGFDSQTLPARVVSLRAGDPALTASLLEATARLSDHFRDRGHPFVTVERRAPVIDHRSRTVDIGLVVAPGPMAGLGYINVSGTKDVDPAVVRSFIYAEPGDPYSPRALAAMRKSVSRIEAIGSVRVREGTALDSEGNLPLQVEVTERPLRVVGASARYSTVDGPALKAYWAHRNLFGGAERLRLDADLFYSFVTQDWSTDPDDRRYSAKNLGGRLALSFLKPALGGTRNDLLVDVVALREHTKYYTSNFVNGAVAVRHRFTDSFSVQAGAETEFGQSIDPLGTLNYGLVGLPVGVAYDSTDRPLDPTRGFKLTASAAPYFGFIDAAPFFGIGRAQASTYVALDEGARTIIAARVGFGSIVGGELAQIPASRRFYAGGGGSVRGYEYKSLGPRDAQGFVIGGRSLFEASLEARIRITDTFGVVPFVDVGQAYASSFPDGSEQLRVAAGLGLRYYTAIGPIRVDVATPLDRRSGERPYAIYVSLGQAF